MSARRRAWPVASAGAATACAALPCAALLCAALLCGALACAAPPATTSTTPAPRPAATNAARGTGDDTSGTGLVPPGYGTLRQDDIAVRVQLVGGVTVRAIPLDEGLIRLLSPDSYRALRDLRGSRRAQIDSIAARTGRGTRVSVWYVSFFGVEQGEARFSPYEFIVTNAGRDFRPLDVLPITPGFGGQRLRQRETQSALYVFDGQLDVNQPLTVTVETTQSDAWSRDILQRVERERALVRSRASRAGSTGE